MPRVASFKGPEASTNGLPTRWYLRFRHRSFDPSGANRVAIGKEETDEAIRWPAFNFSALWGSLKSQSRTVDSGLYFNQCRCAGTGN
jgi:hypothetical protein